MNFKALWKYLIAAVILGALVFLMATLDIRSSAAQKERTCSGIAVDFTGNGTPTVTEAEVKAFISKDYGNISGRRLEEIDLTRIEEIIDGKGAILKSEAYTTDDGVLHILITERIPAARLISGSSSWYADMDGYIFPVHSKASFMVPIIDGSIPLNISPGFKGQPETAGERQWLGGVLDLVDFLKHNRKWSGSIGQVHVNGNGHLVAVPRQGKERFYLGRPEEFGVKFARIENYYRYIVPARGNDAYSYVNVAFDGQIVCRKQYEYGH